MSSRFIFLLGLALAVSAPSQVRASDTHYQDVIIGERAFGMGGAFTALATDGSATFYNPAGMVFIQRSSFSLNASVYGLFRRVWSGGLRIDGNVSDKHDQDVLTFPNSVSSLWLLSKGRADGRFRQTLGVSMYTLTQDNRTQRLELDNIRLPVLNQGVSGLVLDMNSYSRLVRREETLYRATVSYAIRLHRQWAIGISLVTYIRLLDQFEERSGTGTALVAGNSEPSVVNLHNLQKLSMTHISFSGAIGVIWRSSFGLRVGLNIDLPNLKIWGSSDLVEDFQNWGSLFSASAAQINNTKAFKPVFKLPTKISLGIAYERPKKWAIAADVRFYLPESRHTVLRGPSSAPKGWEGTELQWSSLKQKVESDFTLEKKFVVNVNLGAELYPHRNWPIRAGFYTNFGNQPEFQIDANPNDGSFNAYGATLMVGYEGRRTSIMVGVNYTYAKGRFLSFDDQGRTGSTQWRHGILFVISNSYHFE